MSLDGTKSARAAKRRGMDLAQRKLKSDNKKRRKRRLSYRPVTFSKAAGTDLIPANLHSETQTVEKPDGTFQFHTF